MISFREITLNGYILIGVGLFLLYFGSTMITVPYQRLHAVGFLLSGAGSVVLGATNGFADMSPLGRCLAKLAVIAFIVGLPILCFYIYDIIASE